MRANTCELKLSISFEAGLDFWVTDFASPLPAVSIHCKSNPFEKNLDGELVSSNDSPVIINALLLVLLTFGCESIVSRASIKRDIRVGFTTFFSWLRSIVRVRMMPSWSSQSTLVA